MQTNENDRFTVPNIPSCVTAPEDPGHNFQPIGKNKVYCTKCSSVVKFSSEKKGK